MSKIQIIEVKQIDNSFVEFVIIDRGNDEFTSMPKSVWDAQQEQLTENPTEDDE